jgi:Cupin superfamily protein
MGKGDPAVFFSETWSRDAKLYLKAFTPSYILTLGSFETLLATLNRAHEGWLHFARGGLKPIPMDMVDGQGMLDLSRVRGAFAAGETLYLTKAERICEPLMRLARAIEVDLALRGAQLREPVNAHVFLTPPHSQGFPAHRDEHASFVLQLDGCKEWVVYEPDARGIQRTGEMDAESLRRSKSRTFHLTAGDVLYLPEWWPHEARAASEHSLHVTLRLFPLRWIDVLIETCRDHFELARALPLGVGRTSESMKTKLLALLDSEPFRRELSVLLEAFARKQSVPKTSLPDDGFRQILEADAICLETPLVRRANTVCEVSDIGQEVLISFPGGVIRGPGEIKPVFRFVASTLTLRARDLPPLDGLDYDRVEVARTLVKGGLLRTGDMDQ